ncbi:hypothetical protein [Pseudorhodoplanes sp.]|uniref:hypothetical protein n=1 Tax=Pseudorhodoplanes sp. TaxID=1934341 RepID=UPI002CAA3FBC|nr:hypothetical protein [Pseudorhodoplanes sp.]HWV40973.1 hypothetical protein [Pseudorhodoplanes sp.]
MQRHLKAAVACFATILLHSFAALAADIAPMPVKAIPAPAPYDPWRVDITPYGWLPSLNGSSTIKGQTFDIDASFFGDIIHRKIPKELFGLMTAFEARNDRFAVLADFVYLKLGASKGAARAISPGPISTLSVSASLDAKVEMIITELAGAYEIARWGAPAATMTSIDIYGGGRLWWQQAEADLNVTAALALQLPKHAYVISGGKAVAKSGDEAWVDPMVGMRLRHQFTPGHEVTVSGDVGGFGAGSEFSWQAVGLYRFEVHRTATAIWSGLVGYRALYVDYSKGAGTTLYAFDMLQHGPVFGLSLRF